MVIPYPEGAKLELWVVDTGALDTIAIYLNGSLIDYIGDQTTKKSAIQRPPTGKSIAIAVHFGGNDGGYSAIVDTTGGQSKNIQKLGPADGLRHSFILEGVS
jgi:hypothetical protein